MKLLLLVSLIIAPLAVFAADAEHDFSGTYKCHGHDPYLNKDYTGTVTIKPQNTVYAVTMKYSTNEDYVATGGLYDNDTIAVVFQDPKDLKQVGLERYSVSKNNPSAIQGYWVYLGKDMLGKELCEKQKPDVVQIPAK